MKTESDTPPNPQSFVELGDTVHELQVGVTAGESKHDKDETHTATAVRGFVVAHSLSMAPSMTVASRRTSMRRIGDRRT